MSTRSKQLDTSPPARAAGVGAPIRANQRAGRGYQTKPRYARHISWRAAITLFAGIVIIGVLLANWIVGEVRVPKGQVAIEGSTSYNWGNVPIEGGDITTRFPLKVDGDALAVDITSS